MVVTRMLAHMHTTAFLMTFPENRLLPEMSSAGFSQAGLLQQLKERASSFPCRAFSNRSAALTLLLIVQRCKRLLQSFSSEIENVRLNERPWLQIRICKLFLSLHPILTDTSSFSLLPIKCLAADIPLTFTI